MGALDIPDSPRDVYFYLSAVGVNITILVISIIAYLLDDVDYTKTGLYLITAISSTATLLFLAGERWYLVDDEPWSRKLIRAMSTTVSIVVGSVVLGKYLISQDAKEVETILTICLLSVAFFGDLYNERENVVRGESWDVKLSKWKLASMFGYGVAALVLAVSIYWMTDFRQFVSSNVNMWVFLGLTFLILFYKMRFFHSCLEITRENILLKQFLNISLLFSSAMVYSLSGKIHADEGDVLAENSKDRNVLMILSYIGLFVTIAVTTVDRVNIGKEDTVAVEVSSSNKQTFRMLQF
ncbi:MAG: hypothetical protein CL881_03880 [Dehalococcoidia bacterium]|nr:hypothetical protein [Dehalococcoidia bacterium]